MKRTALITGASSGLGYEFVKLFAADGYNLVLVARNEQKLKEIQGEFPLTKMTILAKDLSEIGAVKEIYDEVQNLGIEIDALVNNAGFGLLGEFNNLDIQKQLNMIRLNVSALTELTYFVLTDMKKRNSGKIMNVASTAAFQPGPLMAVYYATKAYVLSFSEALVEELAGRDITVTTLCPGATKTNFGAVANVEETKMFSRAMSSQVVAKQGYSAMMAGKRVVVTGVVNKTGAMAAKFLPRSISAKLAKYVAGEK